MLNLIGREHRERELSNHLPPMQNRLGDSQFEVVTHKGKVYLHPRGQAPDTVEATAPRPDPLRALAHERDRRRRALADYDRHIAASEGDPQLQAVWLDLKHREAEVVPRLERHLAQGPGALS